MKRINSLNDLLIEELEDLLNAESQLIEALPKMAQACQSSILKDALEDHWEVTKEHLNRLQDIFSNIGQSPQGGTCKAMEELIKEAENVIDDAQQYPACDTAIISVVKRIEKYEIAGYGTASEHANDLGRTRIVELLDTILNEERAMILHLNELIQNMINIQARGGFYIPEERFIRGGIKTRSKNMDVSRYIEEGNPNIQEPEESKGKQGDQELQNPEEEGDLS